MAEVPSQNEIGHVINRLRSSGCDIREVRVSLATLIFLRWAVEDVGDPLLLRQRREGDL